MEHPFLRNEMLWAPEAQARLRSAHVLLLGLGGVGSYAAECLARSGIGKLTLVDSDTVALSNINRQLIALESTLGRPKVEVAKERVLQINPACRVEARQLFFTPESAGEVGFSQYDYVADAIDTVTGKLELIRRCREAGVPVISCMGTGNKLDPTAFRVTAMEKTSGCPLARVMRRELKKRGITGVKAVWSPEEPLAPAPSPDDQKGTAGRPTPGSMAFVPSAAGLILAGEIVKDLLGETLRKGGERHG